MSNDAPTRLSLAMVWVGAAVLLGSLLFVADAAEGPLDDPDQAHQRPGFLDEGDLPVAAPDLPGDALEDGRPAVVFFERPRRLETLCDALAGDDLDRRAEIVVIVSGEDGECEGARSVDDPNGELAAAFGLREPSDGGPPVGYAVVDSDGRVRYRTLDPQAADDLEEVETIVKAVP
ncbi:MAG: hypothetical protein ACT4PI_05395 [Actinomycetota bacterium]